MRDVYNIPCTFKMYAHKIPLSAGTYTHRKIHFRHLRLVICGVRGTVLKLGIGELGIKENIYTKQKERTSEDIVP